MTEKERVIIYVDKNNYLIEVEDLVHFPIHGAFKFVEENGERFFRHIETPGFISTPDRDFVRQLGTKMTQLISPKETYKKTIEHVNMGGKFLTIVFDDYTYIILKVSIKNKKYTIDIKRSNLPEEISDITKKFFDKFSSTKIDIKQNSSLPITNFECKGNKCPERIVCSDCGGDKWELFRNPEDLKNSEFEMQCLCCHSIVGLGLKK